MLSNKEKIQRVKDENISLYGFIQKFWHVIERGKRFVDGPHIRAICDTLEAVNAGKIKRLLVNMPPRHAKSTIINVMYRVWCWIQRPWLKFLCASYALSLSVRDNVKCRRLIQSPDFQETYGHLFKPAKDQNAKIKFENSKGGVAQAVSTTSATTGDGGDILIIDDAHKIDDKESENARQKTLDWFKDTWYTRLNDPDATVMIVVGQRVHEQDISGFILSGATGETWVHLNLPSEYEPQNKCVINVPGFRWSDWREMEGELLWEERFNDTYLDHAKKRHGPYEYSSLYQQAPIPAKGSIFSQSNERFYTYNLERDCFILHTPEGTKTVLIDSCYEIITSDVAAKATEKNDYTVFALWAVTPDNDILLLDLWRDRWSIPEQKKKARAFFQRHHSHRFRAFYFEDVAYQGAIAQDLLLEGIPMLPFKPVGDKVQRATGAGIWQDAGKFYFPQDAPWLDDFKIELYKFPKWAYDDQVDNVSMVSMIVRLQNFVDVDEELTESFGVRYN